VVYLLFCKDNYYLFSYTGKLDRSDLAGIVCGFEGGELKEFRDITNEPEFLV